MRCLVPPNEARANFDLKIFICAKGGTKKARPAGFDLPINLDSNRKELIIYEPRKILLAKSLQSGLADRNGPWADGASESWGRRAFSMLSAGLRRSAPKAIRWKRSRRSCGGRTSVLTSRA